MTLLKFRELEPEEMDDPAIPRDKHEQALKGLARLNLISGAASSIWGGLNSMGLGFRPYGDPPTVLDIATGGGDVPIALAQKARQSGVKLRVSGADRSPTAIDYARNRAHRSDVPIDWLIRDTLEEPIPSGYDFICCCLFLHHLSNDAVVGLLARMAEAAGRGIIINDLQRSSLNLGLVWLGAHLLSRSEVVHRDSVRSVRAAFSLSEMSCLASQAGLFDATIRQSFPCRFRLTWAKR